MRESLPSVGAALLLVKEPVPDEAVALPDTPHVFRRKVFMPHDVVKAFERLVRRRLDEIRRWNEAIINLFECHCHAASSSLSFSSNMRR